MDDDAVLAAVGPRLRALRLERGTTLTDLSQTTGISVSTLSRLETGGRRPTLELLLPLATAHDVPLDDLVGTARASDPRVAHRPVTHHGITYLPLTRSVGGIRAYKVIIQPRDQTGELRTHDGYEWFYVLAGKLELTLSEQVLVLGPGEAAEFDTRVPHAIRPAGDRPVELLSLFGPQGERLHLRARTTTR